jgi:DNA-binding transcriptional MerR regulator
MYTTQQLFNVFQVSHQTIKNWCAEFADYLSPTATPQAKHRRLFTEDDLRVFDLVKQLKGEGKRYEDIKAALGAGMRGGVPEMPTAIVPARQNGQLTAALQHIKLLQAELDVEREMRKVAETMKARTEGRVEQLEKQLEEERERVFQLRMKLEFHDKK